MRNFKRDPYCHTLAETYVTAINILAVEYLIKTNDDETYGKYCDVVYNLSDYELSMLEPILAINRHTSSLGAMITQGDYNKQKRILMNYLASKIEEGFLI